MTIGCRKGLLKANLIQGIVWLTIAIIETLHTITTDSLDSFGMSCVYFILNPTSFRKVKYIFL